MDVDYLNQITEDQVCSNAIIPDVKLHVKFTGTPPFRYRLVGTDGTRIDGIVSFDTIDVITVKPVVTTTYAIELLEDNSNCVNDDFVKPEITVIVTDVQFATPEVMACDDNIIVDIQVIDAKVYTIDVTLDSKVILKNYEIGQGLNKIPIDIPSDVTFGTHPVTITIDGCDFTFTMVYGGSAGTTLIHRRWEDNNDVLVVSNYYCNDGGGYYNGGFEFTSFQWYKNGVEIPGATQQYYQDPLGLNGEYAVRLGGYKVDCNGNRLGDRVEFTTCDQSFGSTSSVRVYPVPAQVNETVIVEFDMTPAELDGAVLDIYDAKGAHIQHILVVSSRTQVDGFKSQGTYFGRITTGTNEIRAIKFVIVK